MVCPKYLDIGFAIVATRKPYRGVERTISLDDLPFTRDNYDNLLNLYLEYEEYWDSIFGKPITKENLLELISFYEKLSQYGVACELIVYDNSPIIDLFGLQFEFLGIDIEINTIEGLLDTEQEEIKALLNNNRLCPNKEVIEKLLPVLNYDNGEVETFYVYRIVNV